MVFQCGCYNVCCFFSCSLFKKAQASSRHVNEFNAFVLSVTAFGNYRKPLCEIIFFFVYFLFDLNGTAFLPEKNRGQSEENVLWGARDGAVVRALASHQCGPGSNPSVNAICGMSLLLVLSFAPRGFSPSPHKTNISKFQIDQESGRRRTTLWTCYLQIIIINERGGHWGILELMKLMN